MREAVDIALEEKEDMIGELSIFFLKFIIKNQSIINKTLIIPSSMVVYVYNTEGHCKFPLPGTVIFYAR